MLHYRAARGAGASVFAATIAAFSAWAAADRTETFDFVTPINVGASLPRTTVDWNYFLGTEFDSPLRVGGITGNPNAVVIPQVKAGPVIIIPEVRADTRTGVRLTGDVQGRTGIDLHAGFDSGGVDAGANFQFGPTLTMPDTIRRGEFFDMRGSVGMSGGTNFDVDLPSVNAGADLVFQLKVDGKAEAGLFPFVPYRVGPWGFDIDIDFSLFDFNFDLNFPEFPDFTFFDLPIPELADATGDVFRKQISVSPKPKTPGGPTVGPRIDVGEVQLVKPVGDNVKVTKNLNADGFDYTVDADLLRLGIDIDGLVTAALAGDSFTRQEFEVSSIGKLIAELIDVKYGPELGMEIHSNVTPYLNADLTFDGPVILNEDGNLTIVNPGQTLNVRWDQIPQIALLGDAPVNVDVDFTRMQALMSQTGNLTLTDYMELRVLELIAQIKVGKLNVTLADIGPLIHKRFSILGELLGELDIPIFQTDFDPVTIGLPDEVLNTMHRFTLAPTPTKKVYLSSTNFDIDPQLFLSLQDGTIPTTLSDKTLVIGLGDGTQTNTGQLTPADVTDHGTKTTLVTPPNPFDPDGDSRVVDDARVTIAIDGIEILPGSSYTQQGARDYKLPRIRNDGEYHGAGYTELRATGSSLIFEGSGLTWFDHPVEITAPLLINGPGHTLLLETPIEQLVYDVTHFGIQTDIFRRYHKLNVSQAVNNAGQFIIDGVHENGDTFGLGFDWAMSANLTNTATGQFVLRNGTTMRLNLPLINNQGLIEVAGAGSKLTLNRSAMAASDTAGTGRFVASDGGEIHFSGANLTILNNARFEANHGTVRFNANLVAGSAKVNLITDPQGTIVLNGIDFGTISGPAASFKPGVNIFNRGLLDIQSGKNLLFLQGPLTPGGGGTTSVIKPINLVNEGTVRIHGGAQFGFEIEITDYAEGGATLAGGKWELIGNAPSATFFDNTTPIASANSAQTAILETVVTKITNNGNVLGGSYDIENFDTDLRTNAANVTLSGQALFPYFNTLADNQGSLALKNKHRFTTVGDLANSGQITVEGNSRLDVNGKLTVDEGSVFVELGSIISAATGAGASAVEVIGGTFTFIRAPGPLNINSPWVVREKWVGLDESGNDIILPALAQYPNNTFPTINSAADITIAGKQARFQPLDGLNLIHGKLHITEGNEFSLNQNLTVSATGHLTVDAAGKMFINGSLTSSGQLSVGDQSYIKANTISLLTGTVLLDGVIEALNVTVNPSVTVTGAGTFSGSFANNGTLAPGNSPGITEFFGDYTQSHNATLQIEIAGHAQPGVDPDGHDQVRVAGSATLDGILDVLLLNSFTPHYGDLFEILTYGALTGHFTTERGLLLSPTLGLAPVYMDSGLTLLATAPGDADGDGDVDDDDLNLVSAHLGLTGIWNDGDFNGDALINSLDMDFVSANFGFVIPEPSSGVVVLSALIGAGLATRQRRA